MFHSACLISAMTSSGDRYVMAFLSSAPWWKRNLLATKAGGAIDCCWAGWDGRGGGAAEVGTCAMLDDRVDAVR